MNEPFQTRTGRRRPLPETHLALRGTHRLARSLAGASVGAVRTSKRSQTESGGATQSVLGHRQAGTVTLPPLGGTAHLMLTPSDTAQLDKKFVKAFITNI